MASLVDTNVLVYRVDPRFPDKQRIAHEVLRSGLAADALILAHQALLEFVAAVTRPRADLDGQPLLPRATAQRKVENLIFEFPVVYPDEELVFRALQAAAAYGLSWYDAHMLAYAQVNGCDEILSEDFEHGRHYGGVRAYDPFLAASDSVHELPPLYEEEPDAEGAKRSP